MSSHLTPPRKRPNSQRQTTMEKTLALALTLLAAATALRAQDRARMIRSGNSTDYTTLQEAFDDASALGGTLEIRVVTGTFDELLSLTVEAGDNFDISGGWEPDFSGQFIGLRSTTQPSIAGTALHVDISGGSLQLQDFNVNLATNQGPAGLLLEATGGETFLYDMRITSSTTTGVEGQPTPPPIQGAGIHIGASGATIDLERVDSSNNRAQPSATSGIDSVSGAGAYVDAVNSSIYWAESWFHGNMCLGLFQEEAEARGCNIFVNARGSSNVTLANNRFEEPESTWFLDTTGPDTHVLNGLLTCADEAFLDEYNNQWIGGEAQHRDAGPALYLWARDNCRLRARSSLVARAPHKGVFILAQDVSAGPDLTVEISNYTVVDNGIDDHESYGVKGNNQGNSAMFSVSNLLSHWNGINRFQPNDNYSIAGTVNESNNLSQVDPLFVDFQGGDYSLLASSPAREAGNPTPPGGLTSRDVRGQPRVWGIVDVGAIEMQDSGEMPLFSDGFESGDTTMWSSP